MSRQANDETTGPLAKTPLYEEHRQLGAKMLEFGGWLMPISYTSVLKEHEAVRQHVGVFDVSHMGEFVVSGRGAQAFLQWLTINDVTRLAVGEGQYSAFCYEHGGMVDDLILYRIGNERFFICVNAANIAKDWRWVEEQRNTFLAQRGKEWQAADVVIGNESQAWSQLAVQGPKSLKALEALLSPKDFATVSRLPYTHITTVELGDGRVAAIARTGYTGEKGYELYLHPESAVACWRKLLGLKESLGLQPIGLGARDTLRLEACYLLYGNDMNDEVSPLEAGIGWATKLDKGEFLGRAALRSQKDRGVPRKLYAFHMVDQGIPRHDMLVYATPDARDAIGKVTSGSVLPTVGGAGGMALLTKPSLEIDSSIYIDVRGSRRQARVVKRPIYAGHVKD